MSQPWREAAIQELFGEWVRAEISIICEWGSVSGVGPFLEDAKRRAERLDIVWLESWTPEWYREWCRDCEET